jgi:hypothetical protein
MFNLVVHKVTTVVYRVKGYRKLLQVIGNQNFREELSNLLSVIPGETPHFLQLPL